MAVKKVGGSSKNGRDSNSKRLGVKIFGGGFAKSGSIIVRQNGCRFFPGKNVFLSKNFSIHAKKDGIVSFRKKRLRKIIDII